LAIKTPFGPGDITNRLAIKENVKTSDHVICTPLPNGGQRGVRHTVKAMQLLCQAQKAPLNKSSAICSLLHVPELIRKRGSTPYSAASGSSLS
jgi:hypothetical protein